MSEIRDLLKECWRAGQKYGGNWTYDNFNDFLDKHKDEINKISGPSVCVNCDREKDTHNICQECLTKIINENKL